MVLLVGVMAAGLLVYAKRYELVLSYMQKNEKTQEMIILQMISIAKPIIEKDIHMTLPQKILSSLTGRRNEAERRTGALQDVRAFAENGFKSQRLKFMDVHKLSSLHGFKLQDYDFALGWKQGNSEEALAAFTFDFLKRKAGRMQINKNCSFFSELKSTIEKKARAN
ncbi:MAG: hypothetical protein PHI34_04260 [Acidobacteriota bacterium]|nr:hypothetical protein [Acidobacteriota bacterium]